ncbi:3-hydroxyacyl-CoA dehydrogenase family protein [Methanocella conradii]|uniref:3-hydroxyacyl-CoA dehydrogenase family protein n=1 Tax=Methanocella conradii TaxID=1175444 RepID=UPI00157DE754|nr:3-hydroxyacyl-CoA dehydrogenase NAD-binding domain-containing protein [Methanocella conradii]
MAVYQCKKCNKKWSYSIKKCIFCHEDVQEINETQYKVIGYTQVNVPSTGNEKTPYIEYLLESANGDRIIKKSFDSYKIGDIITLNEKKKKDLIVGIVGTGQLGSGIAEYMLRNGYPIVIKSRSQDSSNEIISKITKKLSKDNTAEQVQYMLKNMKTTLNYADMKDCDVIIEAVIENINTKKEVFKSLSSVCDKKTIFASNTSSLSIDELAKVTDRPDKVIGMHFFNPVSKMDLIEVVAGKKTSDDTKNFIINFSKELNKKPVTVNNSPGFIVNRLLLPQINDAIKLYESGIASKEDIDSAMKLGLNHPMGPFALADLIGIDVCLLILNTLYTSFKDDRYMPSKSLIELFNQGKLGFKTGEGFYKYE